MLRQTAVIAVAGILALGVSGKPSSTPGSWQVDSRHSDVQLITDGTTDFGKTNINFTLGYARVNGTFKVDEANLANSKLDLHIYPANAMASPIEENGNFKAQWMANRANHTLVCFHSKKIVRMPDGKLQATGELTLTRVDRNVQLDPTEAYSGPVYGPPIIHHISREATFVLDLSPASGKSEAELSGSTSMVRENFPELFRSVLSTNWPTVVQDEKCQTPAGVSEDYRGSQCTGTFMEASGLPPAPTQIGEDYPNASNFNAVVGNQITILLHLRLAPSA